MSRPNFITASACVLAATLLPGCQSPKPPAPVPESVLAGSTFVSSNVLTVPAGAVEVILQDTAVVTESALSLDYAYCRFRPGGTANAARTVAPPAKYLVTSLEYDQSGLRRGYETRPVVWFTLSGGPQNAGGRMGCAASFAAPSRLYVTPAEVQGAVGGYFNVNAAP